MNRFVVLLAVLCAASAGAVAYGAEIDELQRLENQVKTLRTAGRYREALQAAQQMVAGAQRDFAEQPAVIAVSLTYLAHVHSDLGQNDEAEQLYQRALSLNEKVYGPEHQEVANSLNNLATQYEKQAKYAQAEAMYLRSQGILEKVRGPEAIDVSHPLHNLGNLYTSLGRYAEAEAAYLRSLAIREKVLGKHERPVAQTLNCLANLYDVQGRYAEAEPLYLRALAIRKKLVGPTSPEIAYVLGDMAILYQHQARYAEAEPLFRQALAIWEQTVGSDHPSVASNLSGLGNLYEDEGRYAEAELVQRRSLTIRENAFGPEHPQVASSCLGLGNIYRMQGRFAEAEPLYRRALAIREKRLGEAHPEVAATVNNLAVLYHNLGRRAEAEQLYRRALAIREKAFGKEHQTIASTLSNLAMILKEQGRIEEAEPLHRRALSIFEKVLSSDHPDVAHQLLNLGVLLEEEGKFAEAESLAERAVAIDASAGVDATNRFRDYSLRARLRWQAKRTNEALADLNRALDLIEEARGKSSGGERERAGFFGHFASAYERMVGWQQELNRPDQALAAVERSRARSLADQLAEAHVDLLAGLPEEEARQLRERESLAKQQLAELEKRAERATDDETSRAQLRDAREGVVQAYLAIRNASPAYRQLVGKNYKPATLDEIQTRLVGADGLLLEYYLGDKAGYVIVIPPRGGKARVDLLVIDQGQAAKLGVEAGPLTGERMQMILTNETGTGVLQKFRDPAQADTLSDALAALWTVLIPEAERKLLTEGKLKRWIVVPDATLSAFPFETLVVDQGANPKYLLDVAPPLVNTPSATLLLNLLDQPFKAGKGVLSVGDAVYGAATTGESRGARALGSLTASARYGSLRGSLKPLPYTGLESKWVADVFKRAGISTGRLEKQNAREASVRMYGPGNEILHLACHGLVDQSYGNLFGALALTPGPAGSADPADDGYLTLAEIYALNLRGMELAILSACDTNLGPEQRGEGSWSLSRGFLVAGAKRVVASNWLVDDEAAASLVSVFCDGVAKGQSAGDKDYAKSLQAAKRWVRGQDKWKSPYYWGTFVLVGPE